MFEYKIQTPGIYEYPYVDRPVRFTEEFLSQLKLGNKLMVEDEHNGPKLADISQVLWRGDGLYLQTPTELKLGGRGLSTHFRDVELQLDGDGNYLITDGILQKVAVTGNPKDKTTVLYNSDSTGGTNVTYSVPGTLTPPNTPGNGNTGNIHTPSISQKKFEGRENMTEKQSQLEQEIGGLKNQLNSRIQENLAQKDQIKNLKDQLTAKDKEIQKLQEFKTQAEKAQAKKQAEIAKELAGDDEEYFNVLKDMTPSQLKAIQEKQKVKDNTGFKGTGDGGTSVDDDDAKKKKKNQENPYTDDQGNPIPYEEWKKLKGSGW